VYGAYDGAGVATSLGFDFKGQPLEEQRQLFADKTIQPDWLALLEEDTIAAMASAAASLLDAETFSASSSRELGPSDRATNDSLSYWFPTKPGYLYTFRFREDGLWRWSGFVRSEHSPPLPDASDRPVFVHRMVSLGATEDECRQLLGEPFTSTGWWPVERLEYALGGIEFRHGIAER